MPSSATPTQIRADFNEIAALTSHDATPARLEKWIFRNLSVGRGRLLEIGCGVGDLANRLAPLFTAIDAVDLAEGMIEEARRRTAPATAIAFHCADMFEWLQARPDTYDCIVTVATLHHVGMAEALTAMARALKPSGKLLIVDLCHRPGLRQLPVNAVAFIVGAAGEAMSILRRRSSVQLWHAYQRHGRHETYLRLDEVRAIAGATVPGARVSGTLLWRYTLSWEKP